MSSQTNAVAKRVAKNTGILYAKMGVTIFISLYSTRLVLNSLGASDFGIFNVVGGAIAMLGFLHVAMSDATQRFMSYVEGEGDIEKEKRIFNISLLLHFVISLVVGILLLCTGYFFFNGFLNIAASRIGAARLVYGCLVVSTMFTVMSVPYEAVLNAHENMLYYSIVGVVEALLKLMVAFLVVNSNGDKLVVYGVLMACIPLIVLSIMRIYCHRHYQECLIAPRKYWDKTLMHEMANFAGWNLLGCSSGIIAGYGSNMILNKFFGTILNAANGISGQVSGQLLAFSNTMMKAVNPVIVKTEGAGNRVSMFEISFMASKLGLLVFCLFAIPFYVDSGYILRLWLKEVPPYTSIFIEIIIFQIMVEQITLPLNIAISAVGNIRRFNIVSSSILYSEVAALYICFANGMPPYTMRILELGSATLLASYRVYYCSVHCRMDVHLFLRKVFLFCFFSIFLDLAILQLFRYYTGSEIARLILIVLSSSLILTVSFYFAGIDETQQLFFKSKIKKAFIRQRFLL
ncbi:MAG: hypothetical protein QM610_05110 [Chitinophagaceae bacterium]